MLGGLICLGLAGTIFIKRRSIIERCYYDQTFATILTIGSFLIILGTAFFYLTK